MLLLFYLIFGMLLAQKYTVLVLIPAVTLVITIAVIVAHSSTFWGMVCSALIASCSLQVGYLVGISVSYVTSRITNSPFTTFFNAARIVRRHAN